MIVDDVLIFNAVAMTQNLASLAVNANQYGLVDVQAVWTGAPVGNFFIETSNDVGVTAPDGTVSQVTNWTTYTGSISPAGGVAGNFSWHIWATGFKWVRLSYAFTSGSGTVNARLNQKG